MYPIEVHWRSKSESVTRILQTWNVQADSVVFVDDSPMELAEVAAAHPGIECVQFPARDSSSGLAMLRQVRDLFGKSCISEEDRLRAASLRTRAPATGATAEDFLAAAEAEISVDFSAGEDPRVLELVNKTNQFNLNGIRYAQAEWRRRLDCPGAFLEVVSYRDRFGPLGKIAILQGEVHDRCARLRTWAMSCRAFGRRIEHQCLKAVFERLGAETITFDFCATPKNTPLQECLQALLGAPAEPGCSLTQERFDAVCPALYHRVYEIGSPSAGSGRIALSAERYF
jgi:FkbH-like protein